MSTNTIKISFLLAIVIATLCHSRVHTTPTTTTISYRDRVIGCLFSDVCSEDQVCFDDNVFGRCEELNSKSGTFSSSYVYQLDRKTLQLLERELSRLSDEDFTWNSPYTQCILKTILNDRPRTVYDPIACDYLRSLTTTDEQQEQAAAEAAADNPNEEGINVEPTVAGSSRGSIVAGDSDIFNSNKLDSIWNLYVKQRQQQQQQPHRVTSQDLSPSSTAPTSPSSSPLQSPPSSSSPSSYPLNWINSAKGRQEFHGNNNNNNNNNNIPLSDQSVHLKLRSNLKRTVAARKAANIGKSNEQLSDSPASPATDSNKQPNKLKRENGLLLNNLLKNYGSQPEEEHNSQLEDGDDFDLYRALYYKANDEDRAKQHQDQVANYIQYMADSDDSPYIQNSKFTNEQMDVDDNNEEELSRPYLRSYYSAVDSGLRPMSFQSNGELEDNDHDDEDNQLYLVDGPIDRLIGNNPEIRVLRDVDDDEGNDIPEIIDVASDHEDADSDGDEPLILLDVADNDDQSDTAPNDEDPSIMASLIDSMISGQRNNFDSDPDEQISNLSSEVEDDDSDNSAKDLKEILFGDINYNNNYDSVRPNFYREHRYDIKKPGPKYFEEYFFSDLIDNNSNVNEDKISADSYNVDYERKAYHPKSADANPIGSANNLDLPPMKKDNTDNNINNNNNNDNNNNNEPSTNIMSNKPVAEGPVKVDSKSENSIVIRSAEVGEETSLEAIDSTHTYIVIDKILGEEESQRFIQILEQLFKLPRGTFSNLRNEDFQITFKVNPNYRDLNASQIASRIEDFSKQLKEVTGFRIKETGIGDKTKLPVVSATIIKKSNEKFINLTFLICSAILAIISAAFVIFLFRRNANFREKIKYFMKNAEDLTKLDYQDLCRQRMQGKSKEKESDPEKAALTTSDEKEPSKLKNVDTNLANQHATDTQVSCSPGSRSSTSSLVEEPVSSNMDITTGHIILSYMEDHLKKKDRLNREWEALCAYEADPCSTNTALQKQNANKNRYPDILPYDHSRVILNDSTNAHNSDYINANTITDHDPRNPAYIVTQGPLANTKADFWQMVWEQGSVIIVMLTRLRENGLSMSDRYWPEEGSEKFQNYEVHLVSEHIWCDDYLVRSFYLKNLKTAETRTVTQFHFLSWPENGIPPNTKSILDFRRKVNKSYKGRSCPIVVHCSDGIGRTGTYILIDMVLNRMAKGAKEIDIAATLEHIRDQRAGIVKNKAQFEFVLLAVAEEVQAILKALSINN